jgi:hypothetical protein
MSKFRYRCDEAQHPHGTCTQTEQQTPVPCLTSYSPVYFNVPQHACVAGYSERTLMGANIATAHGVRLFAMGHRNSCFFLVKRLSVISLAHCFPTDCLWGLSCMLVHQRVRLKSASTYRITAHGIHASNTPGLGSSQSLTHTQICGNIKSLFAAMHSSSRYSGFRDIALCLTP